MRMAYDDGEMGKEKNQKHSELFIQHSLVNHD